MKLKPYSKYKDSEIEWIGEIPEGWNNYKLKHVVNEFVAGGTPRSDDEKFWAHDEHGIPWVNIGDMTNKEIVTETKKEITVEGQADKGLRILKNGTLLYSIFASLGKVAVLGIDATTNQAILGLIISKKIDTIFLKYYLKNLEEPIITLSNANTQNNLNSTIVKNIEIAIPSLPDQTAIANFLDRKIAKGNALIEKDKKLIALLKEKRTALINHAVTKGLDPKVKLKDSGIQWIGKIPEEWEIRKLKTISKIVLGKMLTNDDKGNYLLKPYLRAQNIFWENVDVSDIKEMWFSPSEIKIYRLSRNDLLVSEGGEVGRTAIWSEGIDECYIQNSVHKVTILPEHNPRYFLYVFERFGLLGYFESIVNRVSIGHLTREKLKEVNCIVPPLSDQTAIANYLDQNTSKIDKTIKIIEKKIKLLEEYKKSLIHHTVTGKMDVRGVEA